MKVNQYDVELEITAVPATIEGVLLGKRGENSPTEIILLRHNAPGLAITTTNAMQLSACLAAALKELENQ